MKLNRCTLADRRQYLFETDVGCARTNRFLFVQTTRTVRREGLSSLYPLMLSSALRCLRPSCFSPAFSRQLLHHQPRMEHSGPRPVESTIQTKLTQALKPEHLEVINESHMHAVPTGSESHFRVLVVSPQFEGLSLLQRHRLVNEALKEELSTCIHALAIQAKTPQQWSSNPSLARSPPCLGGSKHDNTMAEKLKAGRD